MFGHQSRGSSLHSSTNVKSGLIFLHYSIMINFYNQLTSENISFKYIIGCVVLNWSTTREFQIHVCTSETAKNKRLVLIN